MTPTYRRKDKAPQEEERTEVPHRRNPFSVITGSLNEIRERYAHIRKVVWATCAMVGAEDEDALLETIKELP